MSDSATQTIGVSAPVIPTAAEIYDAIMKDIEPELLSTNLSKLAEQNKDESPEENAQRRERYVKAMVQFEAQYAIYLAEQKQAISAYRRTAIASLEQKSQAKEADTLTDLEAAISDA